MNQILIEILEIVIVAAVVVVVRYLVPWLKTRIETSEYKWFYDIILDAVQYAEQTVRGEKTGAEKKALVVSLVNDSLSKKNIGISEEQINAIIESIVFAMNKE